MTSDPAPTPAAVSVAQLVLRAKRLEIEAVRQLAARAELVDAVGQLIHALQRERGASSTFLASQGRHLAEVRRDCIAHGEPVEARLRSLFAAQLDPAQAAPARMLQLMAWVLLGLDALAALRARTERQALPAHEAVAAYSRLIAGLVELVFAVAEAAMLPGISHRLVALLHLVQGKEAAGQERAAGALLYGSGACDEAHQQRVMHLIDAQERSLQVFAQFAPPDLRARWEQEQLSPGTAQLERLRRPLCTARPGATLDSSRSDAWFDVTSGRIAVLWDLQVALVAGLREECGHQIRAAQADLQDSEGLLRQLRDHPPPHPHAVPDLAGASAAPGGGEPAPLFELLQSQSAKLAAVEAELAAARRTLHERKVIERAKGVLMSRFGWTEEAAFRALQKTSMDHNRRLVDVAEATLALPELTGVQPAEVPPPVHHR